ncbi:hypothetical protein SporoP37_11430 [Sporosarcina sp. P37]|uniref:GNAT family N-acetyltransferase n=1 Tax=unclassified Sporosarcina TaxID=2647733 RepID=UPI0009BE5059|nr:MULTISPECIES: GNAT family N-acetyltransferase [unclassified Sporosarcina]ARD48702.1 hypothetical protein SporoP33_11025 [Sporosarcina sp. P33]ARK25207.1 hypothetical protein SporoP37_11430 [Sporosarcina sp. P37]PID17078.1 N-acetyltransferase [Sporosarcina sp. P35]
MNKQTLNTQQMGLQHLATNRRTVNKLFEFVLVDFEFLDHIPFPIMRSALKKKILHAVYLTDGINVYGYAIYQRIPKYGGIHVLYLAIAPDYRSFGLGSILLQRLNAMSPEGILLEVEDPDFAKNESELSVRTRRIAFYERNGLMLNKTVKLTNFKHPLLLMTSTELPPLNGRSFRQFYRQLYNRVYRVPIGKIAINARVVKE